MRPPRRHRNLAALLAAGAGLALFVWALRDAGLHQVVASLERVGAGFVLILAISATRPVTRAAAWRLCLEERTPLPLGAAVSASITGTALGDLTPLGVLLSEPAKAVLVRERVGLVTALSTLTVENLLYTLSVVVMILAGTAAFLASFPVPDSLRRLGLLLVAATVALAVAALAVMWTRVRLASGLLVRLARVDPIGRMVAPRIPAVRLLEDQVFAFASRHPGRLVPLALLEASFHASAIAEVWVTLALLGLHPTVLGAFVLEYVDRVVTVVFKFVPLRLGVDEAGTGLAAGILGLGTAPGVALAIVRKARVLVWTAVGVLLLMRRGVTPREMIERAAIEE